MTDSPQNTPPGENPFPLWNFLIAGIILLIVIFALLVIFQYLPIGEMLRASPF